jgi:hypothetical protein
MRVLVFDDNAAIGRLVVRIATMLGMEAVAAPWQNDPSAVWAPTGRDGGALQG